MDDLLDFLHKMNEVEWSRQDGAQKDDALDDNEIDEEDERIQKQIVDCAVYNTKMEG